jgi:hypothetical protein
MIFNIYYLNFPKAYEIKMMLSNVIELGGEIQQDKSQGKEIDFRSKFGVRFLTAFDLGAEAGGKNTKSDSQKVLETFEIKTTKSIILNEIIEKSKNILDFENIKEGNLIKIDNVNLSLENETELRTVKLFNSGAFKGMNLPGIEGLDANQIINSMFKDYAYKLKGVIESFDDEILIKIPLTFSNEFESSYSVDDLFIGKVSIIGLYKGKIQLDSLKNSFEFFQELGIVQPSNDDNSQFKEIQDSQYEIKNETPSLFVSSKNGKEKYHYIDLLAIIQNIDITD